MPCRCPPPPPKPILSNSGNNDNFYTQKKRIANLIQSHRRGGRITYVKTTPTSIIGPRNTF